MNILNKINYKKELKRKVEEALELCELFFELNKKRAPTNDEKSAFVHWFIINSSTKIKDKLIKYKEDR